MKYSILFLWVMVTLHLSAQTQHIRGTVKDSKGTALVGVTIADKLHPQLATRSDQAGNFEITFPDTLSHSLAISHVGYMSDIIQVQHAAAPVNLVLKEQGSNIEEVVIVSNRDKETRDEVPSSISVLSSKKIAALNQFSTSMNDIMAWVPGMSVGNNRQSNRGQKLRGGNMLVLIDGIPQSTPLLIDDTFNFIDPAVVDRIEVIKGSTSIYGNGAAGGIINIITKKGNTDRKIASHTEVGASSYLVTPHHTSGINLSQYFSGQLNKLNYTVGGSYKNYGITRSAKGEILSPQDGMGESSWYNGFAKLGYDIGKGYNLELMYNYFSNEQVSELIPTDGHYGQNTATGVFGKRNPNLKGQGVHYNHNLRFALDKANIFQNTDFNATYYWQKSSTLYANFDYYTDISHGYIGGQNFTNTNQMGIRVNFNTRYKLSDRLNGNLIYGLDLLNNKTSQPMADGRWYTPEMNMKNYAAYLQLKTKFDDFIFKAGTRAEHIHIGVDDYTTLYRDNGTVTGGGLAIHGGNLNFNALTFNAAARYNKLSYVQPYLSFSQSFSVGELGKTLRVATDPDVISEKLQDTKAVITNSYEAGLEGRISNFMRYSANYFIYHQKLGTTYIMNPETHFFDLSRLPEKINGAEFELGFFLTKNLDVDLSLSLLEGKTDNDGNGKFSDADDQYMDGSRINAPIFRSSINYKITPKWNVNFMGTLVGNRNRFDDILDDGTYVYGHGPVHSYFVGNLFSSVQLTSSTKLSLGIENLFNKDYYPPFSQWYGNDSFYIKGNGINGRLSLSIDL